MQQVPGKQFETFERVNLKLQESRLPITVIIFVCISSQFANIAGNDPKWAWRAQVFKIADMETGRKLVETSAGLHVSIFVFGYPVEKMTYNCYILNLDGDYSIYRPRQWNHLCMSWSSGGPSKVVLVSVVIPK